MLFAFIAKFGFVMKLLRYVRLNFINCTQFISRLAAFIPPMFTFCSAKKGAHLQQVSLISLIGDIVPEKILIDFEQAALNAF